MDPRGGSSAAADPSSEGHTRVAAGPPPTLPAEASAVRPLVDMVLALVPDAAVVVDEHGTIVSVNDNVEALFGYEADQLVGATIETLVPERLRHRHRQSRSDFLAHPNVRPMGANLELFGRRRDGSEFPVDVSLAPISTADRPLVVAAIRDVTERRATEAVHARLAAIVQGSLDAILAITVNGAVTSWNPAAEATLGWVGDEILGEHVSRLIPPDASPHFEDQLDAAIRGDNPPRADTEWLTRDGRRLPVAASVSPLRDSRGDLTGFSVVLRDITERKRAEARLRRLLHVTERQARWQEVSAELRLALLTEDDADSVLHLMAQRLGELIGSCGVAVVRTSARASATVAAAWGSAAALAGVPTPLPPLPEDRRFHVVGATDLDAPLSDAFGGADVLVVPVHRSDATVGVLLCGLPIEEPSRPVGAEVVGHVLDPDGVAGTGPDAHDAMAVSVADQMALALELDRARADHERLLLADERERIARDLHDHAVQSLFATGLSLQSILPLVDEERVAGRIHEAVESMDATIRQIRTAIFRLSAPTAAGTGLRSELVRLCAEAARGMGFEPSLSFEGPVDNGVPPETATHLLAVAREALSNVSRHAHAGKVSLVVSVDRERARLTIADDGVGSAAGGVGNGLRNLAARAEGLGGTLEIDSRPGAGTRLTWSVPIS